MRTHLLSSLKLSSSSSSIILTILSILVILSSSSISTLVSGTYNGATLDASVVANSHSSHSHSSLSSHTQDPSALPPPPPIESVQSPLTSAIPPGGNADDISEIGLCEVCMYVMENKMQHQPYLCRGLKDPHYQSTCVNVMESLMWWITNEVYWVNYGCQMNQNGAISWVRPCPASAMCSWLQHLYLRKPFCGEQKNFPKPV